MQLHGVRFAAFAAAILLLFACGGGTAFAQSDPEEAPLTLTVTLAGKDSSLAFACEAVSPKDTDGDGALTVHDVLTCAHETLWQGEGDGYRAERTGSEGDLQVLTLWGEETEGCAFRINHLPADLLTSVNDGDFLYIYPLADEAGETPLYCHFDETAATVAGAEKLTLTLLADGTDADGEPAEVPVPGAVICIDGKDTAFVTDENGEVALAFDGSGRCIISARKDGEAFVPPVCAVAVSKEEPFAGDRASLLGWVLLLLAASAGLTVVLRRRTARADRL